MAYRFANNSDKVEFAIAPLSGYTFGPHTWAVLFKRNTLNTQQIPVYTMTAGSSDKVYIQLSAGNNPQFLRSTLATGTQILGSTSLWYLLAASGVGGGTLSRFHVYDGTSWTHVAGSGSAPADQAMLSSDRLFVGPGFSTCLADIVCCGIKKADSTDLQVETLTSASFSTWRSFGFDWLIGFDSSLKVGGILHDQASPGTGDQITIGGTVQVSDPAGWTWVAASGNLAANESLSGGFVRDPYGRLVTVTSGGGALTASEQLSGGFVRDSQGRLMIVASAGGVLTAGEQISGGFVRDPVGRLMVVTSGAVAYSGGYMRDQAGRLVTTVELAGALPATDQFSGGFVRDSAGNLVTINVGF